MVDLTTFAHLAMSVAVAAVVPVGGWLAAKAPGLLQKWFHIQTTQAERDWIKQAASVGCGLLRAKLANSSMAVDKFDVSTGSEHLDAAANAALSVVYSQFKASGVTKDDLQHMILAELGHALGNDPTVPSAPATPKKD